MQETLAALYSTDYHAWVQRNAELLRQGRFDEADIGHLIEELEEMGNSQRHELVSRLRVLLAHLLKWQFQLRQLSERWAEFSGQSWRETIIEQRDAMQNLLADYPSLQGLLPEAIAKAYPAAARLAAKESGLPTTDFPQDCPYAQVDILDDDFYPSNSGK